MKQWIAHAIAGLFLFLVPLAAFAETAPGVITIMPGETVTARVADDSSGFVELSRTSVPAETKGDAPPPAADTVRFTFTVLNGTGRMLDIRNGYGKVLHFKAVMALGRRSAPTSICTIPPRLGSFETWPHPVSHLELSAPSFTPPADQSAGMTISCW